MITAILAQSIDMVIGTTGRDGPTLPWRLPPDLRRFRDLTMGHAVIMGRTTFESIGKALPGRRNIVVSHRPPAEWSGNVAGVEWASSPGHALEVALRSDPSPFVIGGGEIYAALWDRVERIELTRVEVNVGLGLVFGWDPSPFREVAREPEAVTDGTRYQFVTYERTGPWKSPLDAIERGEHVRSNEPKAEGEEP